jgi:hypothetical protein
MESSLISASAEDQVAPRKARQLRGQLIPFQVWRAVTVTSVSFPTHPPKGEVLKLTVTTPLAERLREIRARIIASGVALLTEEEIRREVATRRGGRDAAEYDSDIH